MYPPDGGDLMNSALTRGQVAALALLALALGALPHIIRSAAGNPLFPGDETYAHLLTARAILDHDGLPHLAPRAYHYLLAGLGRLIGLETAARALSALIAALTLLAGYALSRKLKLPAPALGTTILLLSPAFISAAALPGPRPLAVLADLAALLLVLRRKLIPAVVAGLLLAFAASLGPFDALIAIVLAVFLAVRLRDRRWTLLGLAPLALLISTHLPNAISAEPIPGAELVRTFFSDFGGLNGFGVFALLLAAVGFFIIWQSRTYGIGTRVLTALLALSGLRFPAALPYANLPISLFAGIALQKLVRMQWSLRSLRKLSLAVIFCGLLFSTVSHVFLIARLPPSPGYATAFSWLESSTPANARIFSHPDQAGWVAYYAHRVPALVTIPEFPAARSSRERAFEILRSEDLVRTQGLLRGLGATHVILTKDLVGTFWPRKGLGLQFLVTDDETFKRVYTDNFATIWQVRRAAPSG